MLCGETEAVGQAVPCIQTVREKVFQYKSKCPRTVLTDGYYKVMAIAQSLGYIQSDPGTSFRVAHGGLS